MSKYVAKPEITPDEWGHSSGNHSFYKIFKKTHIMGLSEKLNSKLSLKIVN